MTLKDLIPDYHVRSHRPYTYRFTVFTPVYNGQKTIQRVHDSLLKQNFSNFEWLIINDASTDGSHELIINLKENSSLNINYVNNEQNRHKIACLLQAIDLAQGELFLTFDADDECVDNALNILDTEFNDLPEDQKESIIAVTGLCIDQHGQKVGTDFPYSPYFSNPFRAYAIDKVRGEKWGFTKTEKLKGIRYNHDFVTNGFMPEGILWNLLAKQGYRTKYINKVLRIYHIGSENSISTSGMHQTDLGMAVMYIVNFNWFFKSHFYKAPLFFLKNLFFLLRTSKHLDFQLKQYLMALESNLIKFFFILLWPFRKLLT